MSNGRTLYPQEGDFIAAVLAGGQGKRLGMNKALLTIDGSMVLDRIISILRNIFPSILVVVQDDDSPLSGMTDPR